MGGFQLKLPLSRHADVRAVVILAEQTGGYAPGLVTRVIPLFRRPLCQSGATVPDARRATMTSPSAMRYATNTYVECLSRNRSRKAMDR